MPETGTTKPDSTEPKPVELDRTEGELTDEGPEDIVVDLPYVEFVARMIRDVGVDADPDAERMSPALGLGVVVVQDIKMLADKIDPMSEERIKILAPNATPKTNLDKALLWIRQEFRFIDRKFDIPVGKNRTTQGVHGTPHIGGGGYPEAVRKAAAPELELLPKTVKIGLIDTQVYPHDEFEDRPTVIGDGELPRVGPFNHLDIHGTFTVGLILKQAPGADVIVKAVLRHDNAKATVWDVAEAMTEFIDQGVKVLILPLVCFTADGLAPLALQRAVTLLRHCGIAVIAAAGNHGQNPGLRDGEPTNTWPGFPAACDGATAVGATDASGGFKAAFNPQEASWISLAGPGIDVTSTSVTGRIEYVKIQGIKAPPEWHPTFKGWARWSGTSFATATVGAAIAAKADKEGRSPFEVIEELKTQSPAENGGIGRYEGLQPPPPPA